MLTAYERLTRAATWLYGERPDFDELFPSLFAAGRRAGRPASRGEAVAAPAP